MVLFSLSQLCACTVIPGLDLRYEGRLDGAPVDIGGFDLVKVNYQVLGDLNELSSLYQDGLPSSLSARNVNGYLVGAGDVLSIIVWDHPELTNPTGDFRDPESAGRLVSESGEIFYPYIGEIHVAGMTVNQIRRLLTSRLSRVVKNPQIDVRVAAFRSQRVRVYGEVQSPGFVSISDKKLSVLDAIAASGGLTDDAVREVVRLTAMDGQKGLEKSWELSRDELHEVTLRNEDVVYVPHADEYPVYMLGALGNQGVIPLRRGKLSLAEALTVSQGLDEQVADRTKVYVVRVSEDYKRNEKKHGLLESSRSRAIVYLVDLSGFEGLFLSKHFELLPHDIVYVDRTGFAAYNSVINQILPTVTTLFQLDQLRRD